MGLVLSHVFVCVQVHCIYQKLTPLNSSTLTADVQQAACWLEHARWLSVASIQTVLLGLLH